MRRRYIDPQDFSELRRFSGLTREQAADLLDVTRRTVQNWELGKARIPWMAYRMLRIVLHSALPGKEWDGWTLYRGRLYSPNGHWFDAAWLEHNEQVFSMAKLWLQEQARKRKRPAAVVLPFPGALSDSGFDGSIQLRTGGAAR